MNGIFKQRPKIFHKFHFFLTIILYFNQFCQLFCDYFIENALNSLFISFPGHVRKFLENAMKFHPENPLRGNFLKNTNSSAEYGAYESPQAAVSPPYTTGTAVLPPGDLNPQGLPVSRGLQGTRPLRMSRPTMAGGTGTVSACAA